MSDFEERDVEYESKQERLDEARVEAAMPMDNIIRMAAENMLREQGAHTEREAVVKYLRGWVEHLDLDKARLAEEWADAIEKGEHHGK